MDALAKFDRDLVKSVDVAIEPVLFLEDVEAGSIKSWVSTALRTTDDEALRSGDWKKVIGDYLVKGKYILLQKLEGVSTITKSQLLENIQHDLLAEAEKANVQTLLGYVPLSRTQIAAHIASITSSLKFLNEGDKALFEGRGGAPVEFNSKLRVNEAELSELLTTRVISNDGELILKVKKPDFIGSSMWEFQYQGHLIEAKILDEPWLDNFREDGSGVRPGSSLRAQVRIEIFYSDNMQPSLTKYTILTVLQVLPPIPKVEQLFFRPDN